MRWFKLKKREYDGPAGTATEQWVALGKRAPQVTLL